MPSTPPAPLLAQTFLYASFMFLLSSIFSNNSDMLCVLRSFPLPAVSPMFSRLRLIYVSPTSAVGYPQVHTFVCTVTLFSPSATFSFFYDCLLWPLLTSHGKSFSTAGGILRPIPASVRPRGISPCSFLVYPPDLRTWITATFRASLLIANLPAMHALLSGFCP